MCFTPGISLTLALSAFALGAGVIYRGLPIRAGIAIIFVGTMEFLQWTQHFVVATPEDDYSMCASRTNQFLTFLGYVHYCFQPLAIQWICYAMLRRGCLKTRHQADLIGRLCWLYAVMTFGRYLLGAWDPDSLATGSKDCPNYEWFKAGFDPGTGEMTPNLPGRSCTYFPKTTTGHLAWAVPLPEATYMVPHTSLHLFCCWIALLSTPIMTVCCVICTITGPILAIYLSPSINEQPAIWCFFSVMQCSVFPIMVHFLYPKEAKYEETVVHSGGFGEKPIVYRLDRSSMNGKGKSH